jgi:hypothetical protein
MSSHIFFGCPHATCPQTATLTLDEFREIGAPLCPDHHLKMVSKQAEGEGTVKAVGMIMTGLTQLAAAAMSHLRRDE